MAEARAKSPNGGQPVERRDSGADSKLGGSGSQENQGSNEGYSPPGIPQDMESELLRQVTEIVKILNRAHPTKEETWHSDLYSKLKFFATYLGLPSLLIAAILPTYNLFNNAIESLNRQYFERTHINMAEDARFAQDEGALSSR